MKRFMKIIAAVLATVMLLCSAASCASSGTAILEYGKSKITVNMYSYWLSRYKAIYLYTFGVNDTTEFWTTEIATGITAETYLGAIALQGVMSTLVCMEIFDNLGLKLSAEVIEAIDNYIADLIVEHGGGSKSKFNNEVSVFGVNDRILKQIYIAEEKASQLFDYYYGTNGTEKITDLHRDEYYKATYAKIQHLYINTKKEYVLDEEGNRVYDSEGNVKTQDMTGAVLAEKEKIIADIDARLAEGASFEELWAEYSEDKYYENGYYLTASTSGFVNEVVTAAFTMEVGETEKITTSSGTHYVKKYDLDEKAYTNEKNSDFFGDFDSYVAQSFFNKKIQTYLADIIVNEDEIKKYSIRTATPNGSF